MKNTYLIVLLLLTSMSISCAQNNTPCPCCTENHTAFDYWIGDWTVYSTTGQVIGTNSVVQMQDGCVLQENWQASNQGNSGTSYNYFDSSDTSWNQIWISNTGNVLNLKGGLNKDGNMVLKSELVKGARGNYYNQITWSKNSDGSVTQRWDIFGENGDPISKAFEGIYKLTDAD